MINDFSLASEFVTIGVLIFIKYFTCSFIMYEDTNFV